MPKVSIIIPVYNAEKCLAKCFDSLISMSFKDWEMIVVDDGSKDNSPAMCDAYADKDSRIKVFHKSNSGVSNTRNFGLAKAIGDYITFVDSDDYVNSDYLSFFESESADEDVIFSSYEVINKEEKNKIPFGITLSDEKEVVDFVSKYLYSKHIMAPWAKFFKSEVVKGISFDERLRRGEDTKFCLQSLSRCKTLRTVNNSIYYYDLPTSEGKYSMTLNDATLHMDTLFEAYNATPFRNSLFEQNVFAILMNSARDYIQYHPLEFWCNDIVKKYVSKSGESSFKTRLMILLRNNIIKTFLSGLK